MNKIVSHHSFHRAVVAASIFAAAAVMSTPVAALADSPATLVNQVAPEYPSSGRGAGWVQLEFTIGVDGKVHDVSVVQAEPMKMFEASAVKAVSRWTFQPATRDGAPIESHKQIKISFKPE